MARAIGFIMLVAVAVVYCGVKYKQYQDRRITAHQDRLARRNRNSLKLRFNIWQFETADLFPQTQYKPNVTLVCKNPDIEEVFKLGIMGGEKSESLG